MATATGRKTRAKASGGGRARKAAKAPARPRRVTWFALTLIVVGGMLALRLGVNALELLPVHFHEARLWAYGQALDWGYFSAPPLAAAVLRGTTDLLGDTFFALRLYPPAAHALAAWTIYITGARLWDGRTGFWAAVGYTFAPGVAFSSMLASPEPLLMAAWTVALYAFVRGLEARGLGWWIACGAAIGAGSLADLAMAAFPLAALGFLAVSREAERRDWQGFAIACGTGVLVLAPNLVWHAGHGFAALAPVAALGPGDFVPREFAAFLGVLLVAIGPPFVLALFPALLAARQWWQEWQMRLVGWQCFLPLAIVVALAAATGAETAWAAPALIGGSLVAARWLLTAGWSRWLLAQVALGATLTIVLWAAAGLYAVRAPQLPAAADPFAETRVGPRLCELALGAMAEEGATVLLAAEDRLSECMFQGNLGWDEIAVWNPDLVADSQHELVSTLRAGDRRRMVLAFTGDAAPIGHHFAERAEIERGEIQTHRDRAVPYRIWALQGFEGYAGGQ